MNKESKSIIASAKQDVVHVNNDKRDLVTANHRYISGGRGGNEFTQAAYLDKALDWYLATFNTIDGKLVIPIYDFRFISNEDGSERMKCKVADKTLKYLDYSKIQRVRELWQSVDPFRFVKVGPDIGRGLNLSEWLTDEDIIFSVWLYAYENGYLHSSYVNQFTKHGKNMGTGLYYLRLIEIGIYKPSGYYEMSFGGRVYSISSGEGYGDPCRGQNFLNMDVQDYAQQLEDQVVEFDYPQIGD
jgi:hypothetical protein